MPTENHYSHQDWNVVVLQKSDTKKVPNRPQSKENKLDQLTDPQTIKKYSSLHRNNLQKYRLQYGLSQKDIAQKCQIHLKRIQEIENGGLYDSKVIQMIHNKLKINLNKE